MSFLLIPSLFERLVAEMMIGKIVVLFFESLTKHIPLLLWYDMKQRYIPRRELCYCWSKQIKRSIRQYIYDMISVATKKDKTGRKVLKHGTHFYSIHCLPLDLLLKVMSLFSSWWWCDSLSLEVSCVCVCPTFLPIMRYSLYCTKKQETGGRILISQVFLVLLVLLEFYCFSVLTTEESRREAYNKQPTQTKWILDVIWLTKVTLESRIYKVIRKKESMWTDTTYTRIYSIMSVLSDTTITLIVKRKTRATQNILILQRESYKKE